MRGQLAPVYPLKNIDLILHDFSTNIPGNGKIKNRVILDKVNTLSNDIDRYIVSLDNVYYKFQMQNLVELKEHFCDQYFDNPDSHTENLTEELNYFAIKIKLELYKELESQFSITFIFVKLLSPQTYRHFFKHFKGLKEKFMNDHRNL